MTASYIGHSYLKRFFHWKIIIAILFITLIVAIAVAAAIGPVEISPLEVYKIIIQKIPGIGDLITEPSSILNQEVVLIVRLPRVLGA
ncbi:MAG: hypothetical protein GX638_08975, partial [Crenarchaeota archaeon]|nr:hypothetical protein [Thermoproteota archaeon]